MSKFTAKPAKQTVVVDQDEIKKHHGVEKVSLFKDDGTPIKVEYLTSGGGGGTSNHDMLTNRDAEDQHPIGAITGLQDALALFGGSSTVPLYLLATETQLALAGVVTYTSGVSIEFAGPSGFPARVLVIEDGDGSARSYTTDGTDEFALYDAEQLLDVAPESPISEAPLTVFAFQDLYGIDGEENPLSGTSTYSIYGTVAAPTLIPTGGVAEDRLWRKSFDQTFIYNSVGAQSANRYNDWDDLMAALGELEFGNHTIIFEQAETIPSGAWDLNGATLSGLDPANAVRITFADGATLTGLTTELAVKGLELFSISTTPVVTIVGAGTVGIRDGVQMASRSAPFVRFTGDPAGLQVVVLSTGELTKPSGFSTPDGGGDYECVEWTGTPAVAIVIAVDGYCEVAEDTLRSTSEFILLNTDTSAWNFSETQTNAAGGIYINDETRMQASKTTYDNATSGLTADEVQAAIDELASEKANATLTVNTQTDDYTLALSDAGKVVEMNKATACTLTVPTNASVAFPVGTIIEAYAMGAGAVTVAGDGGVTVRNAGDLAAQYATASLRKRDTDEWVLTGNLA